MHFVLFSCLIALARISSTMFNGIGEKQHPGIVLDLEEKAFHLLPLSTLVLGFYRCPLSGWGRQAFLKQETKRTNHNEN